MTVTIPEPEVVQALIATAVKVKSDTTPRTVQSHQGLIGPSDVGFCRNKAALMAKGRQHTDSRSAWAANVGTAIHEFVEDALRTAFPGWLIEPGRVTATLPNGAEIAGTPDVVVPEWNAVLDIKTVDGFAGVKRFGTSQNHKYQRHLYALGAMQNGMLDIERPVYVGNIYFDRSGVEPEPMVVIAEFDPTLTDEISAWVDDVIYAVQHDEDANRDIQAPVCERICEFFTECRGQLPVGEMDVSTDHTIGEAAEMYVEGRRMKKAGTDMMDAAKAILHGMNVLADGWQIRSTFINPSEIPGYTREGYTRIDVTRARTPKAES